MGSTSSITNTLGAILLTIQSSGVQSPISARQLPLLFDHRTYSVTATERLNRSEMCGIGVLTCMHRIRVHLRRIRSVQIPRLILAVVFAAVRGTTTIRSSSGALTVAGSALIAGTTTSAFVFPQDRARIRFTGAAFGSPN